MKNSSLLVFSVIKNVASFVKGKDVDIFKKLHIISLQRANEYHQNNAKRIFNDIENNFYDYRGLVLYLLYNAMMDETITLYDIKDRNIKSVVKLFGKEQLAEDKEFIRKVNQSMNFKHISDFFRLTQEGFPVIFPLIKQKYISPVFFMKYYKKDLTTQKEDVIILSTDYERFLRISNKIKTILIEGV
jgi:hypothetical protein